MSDTRDRKVAVVLGMHRSGTSLLAHVLNILGVELGDRLIPADVNNPDGYWEYEPIKQLQQQLMVFLDRDWTSETGTFPLPEGWLDWPETQPYIERLRAAFVQVLDGTPGFFGFKDPRTAMLLPLWERLFEQCGVNPFYVLSVRHPIAVANSLYKRDKLSRASAELLWLTHTAEALRHAGDRAPVVHYEQWFQYPARLLENLMEHLGLGWSGSRQELEQVVQSTLKPHLNSTVVPVGRITHPYVDRLYDLLLESQNGTLASPAAVRLAGEFLDLRESVRAWTDGIESDRRRDNSQVARFKATEGLEADLPKQIEDLKPRLESARKEIKSLRSRLSGQYKKKPTPAEPPPAGPLLDRIQPRHEYPETARFPSMADRLAGADLTPRKLKICILTQDIFGPIKNGGIGTAFGFAAEFLTRCGHDVSIAYSLGDFSPNGPIQQWVEYYKERGITFIPVPGPEVPPTTGRLGHPRLTVARRSYEYLKDRDFDIIHVSEWSGNGFYCMLAKKLGLAFENTLFCVKTSSPALWNLVGNNKLVHEKTDLIRSYIERKSVEYADVVISPSHHMLRWMLQWGYDLPRGRCVVQPNIMPVSESWKQSGGGKRRELAEAKELVFFGRLDTRKGLEVFCRALALLERRGGLNCKVTFLGNPPLAGDPLAYIEEQAADWSFDWQIITGYDAKQAVDYLREAGRVAVVPSLLDNSPFTIYECLSERIPFLTTDRGGAQELVAAEDQPEVIFTPTPRVLADLLEKVVADGVVIARPSFDFEGSLETWKQFHLALGNNPRLCEPVDADDPPAEPAEPPLVSVCIAHHNRPDKLYQALESVRKQTYPNYEVLVVDDGSDQPEAVAFLDELEPEFKKRGWRIVRQENRYLGAVRNTSAREARGEYLLLMDDDNLAKPHELETFVKAAVHSRADILTCFADVFETEEPPRQETVTSRISFMGDSLGLGLLFNCFGDSNALIRKGVIEELGGFSEDHGVPNMDHEFFARAVLHGYKLYVVPEALYYYRRAGERMTGGSRDHSEKLLAFRPYFNNAPLMLHELLRLAQGSGTRVDGIKPVVAPLNRIIANYSRLKMLLSREGG